MAKAKCFQCGATAQADTFEQARALLNHAIGLARGIKCGDAYGAVQEIKDASAPQVKTISTLIKKEEPKIIETKEEPKVTETMRHKNQDIIDAPTVQPKTETILQPKTETTKIIRRKHRDKKS